MDVVMIGFAAGYGAYLITENYYEQISKRLPESIINRCRELGETDGTISIFDVLSEDAVFVPMGKGGIYKALWELGEKAGKGIIVYAEDLLLKQETIEVCEVVDVNPYALNSKGAAVVISPNGNELVRKLVSCDIPAKVIGHTSDNNDKMMINGEEKRYIPSRITDEYDKLIERGRSNEN